MHNPFISVIIPTFNRVCQVQAAIESVLTQRYQNFELIIVDDSSSDGTVDVVSEMIKEIPHATLLPLDINHGVSFARNRGIEMSQGEWIAFLDSDDLWHKDKLLKQVAYIEDNPECSILQTQEIWIRDGVRVNAPKTHRKRAGDIFAISLKRCMITPSSVLIKSSIFDSYGTFNETFPACEDYDLWLRISAFEEVGLVDELLMTRYGGAEDQLSFTVPLQDIYRIEAIKSLVDSETLSNEKQLLSLKTMVKKCRILANGALKRGNVKRHKQFSQLMNRYNNLLESYNTSK